MLVEKAVLSLDAPILPGEGLGGLLLYTPLTELQDLIMPMVVDGTCRVQLAGSYAPFTLRYTFFDGGLQMDVDARNGKVYQLLAEHGYRGRLLSGIAVGMAVGEALALDSDFYYDEAEGTILHRKYAGIGMDVAESDPPRNLVSRLGIETIYVHIPELYTQAGVRGVW